MTISKKLLISIVTLTAIVLVATLSLARWSFGQGFADFINGLERQRLAQIAATAIIEYEGAGETWQGVERNSIFRNVEEVSRGERGRFRPPPGGRPPPNRSQIDIDSANREPQALDQNALAPLLRKFVPPTHLLDLDGNILLRSERSGPRINQTLTETGIEINYPVTYKGEVIAILRSYNQAPSDISLASEFEQQQLNASFIIGGLSLALSLALAFFISHMFMKPIKQLTSGISKLTQGKYDIVLPQGGSDELAKLMRDTESLAQTLEQARSQKSRWFADISHELRTPLTVLVGEIEAMHAGIRKFDQSQLNSIEQEVQLLHRLVDDLYQLSLSDLGALKYEFNRVDISAIVSAVVSNFTSALDENALSLETQIEPGIECSVDAQRFEQLLNNLLRNSVKYTDYGGRLKVSLLSIDADVHLIVEDSYPGVPQEDCDSLFETLYQRNESRNRANSGAGLGLAICKNIAQSHQANIMARPSERGGLKVIVAFKSGSNN